MATHGGRRPGAGARPGNINALKRGKRSPRYYEAQLMLNALSVLWSQELALPLEARARRRRRHHLLEAANWFLTRQPSYVQYTEELIFGYLGTPGLVPRQEQILQWLEQPRRQPYWARPLALVDYISEHNPDIGEKVSRHLIDWLMAAPALHLQPEEKISGRTIKQSNDQVDPVALCSPRRFMCAAGAAERSNI